MAAVDYYNVSKMEDEPFGEAPEDLDNSDDIHQVFFNVIDCIRWVLYIVIISADIFLMYIICRYKKLRTRLNMYLFNCCLLHICYYLKDILIFIIFRLGIYIPGLYFCMDVNSHTVVMDLYFIFAFVMAIDWLLTSYKPHLMKTFERFYVHFIVVLYICFGIEWAVTMAWCLMDRVSLSSYYTQLHIRTVTYLVILIGITILNILKSKLTLNRNSLKTEYAFTAANIIIYSFMPLLIDYFLSLVFALHIIVVYILLYTVVIFDFVGLVSPIWIIYVLGRKNKHFQMVYDRCFKMSVRIYDDENLSDSEEEEDDVENNTNGPATSNNQDARAILVL